MIRAYRPSAVASVEASMVSGWNITPNVGYVLVLVPGPVACGVSLHNSEKTDVIATGSGLTGSAQPVILYPALGKSIDMLDPELGWHLLLTTTGTEGRIEIPIGPFVDLPDEIHPIYGDESLALAKATGEIDAGTYYVDAASLSCPRGFGWPVGSIARFLFEGGDFNGQVESVGFIGTPDGATDSIEVRRYTAIAPPALGEVTTISAADDFDSTDALTVISGNVLANDDSGIFVSAINGYTTLVGQNVAGTDGGLFTISAGGAWYFNPNGDFNALIDDATATTSVIYYVSDGSSEASAVLTITVSAARHSPVSVSDTSEVTAGYVTGGNVLSNDTDEDNDSLFVSKVNGSAVNVGQPVAGSTGGVFVVYSNGTWTFDTGTDFATLYGEQTTTTSVTYHASDDDGESEGTLTVTVLAGAAAPFWTPDLLSLALWLDASDPETITLNGSTISQWADKSGNDRHATQATATKQPALILSALEGRSLLRFDGSNDYLEAPAVLNTSSPSGAIFVVCKQSGSSTGALLSTRPLSAGQGWTVRMNNATQLAYYNIGYSVSPSGSNLATKPSGYGIVSFVRGANSVFFVVNGICETFQAWSGNDVSSYGKTAIGSENAGTGSFLNGDVCEIIVLEHVPSTSDRERIEGYLAHKWGLAANLPAGHPYKTEAPIVETASSVSWTPAEVTSVLWLDGADSRVISLNGTYVNQWDDKSGNSRHALPVSASDRPVFAAASINGKSSVSFDGAGDYLAVPSFSVTAGIELFFVVSQDQTGSSRNGGIVHFSISSYQPHFGGGPDSVSLQDWYETFFSDNQYSVLQDAISPGLYLGGMIQTGTQIVGRLNAAQVGAVNAGFNGSTGYRHIGSHVGSPAAYPRMKIAEIVLVQSPSADLRQRIEGYLAHKWGLAANLPVDHPYKSGPPSL
ncbi:Bacterial Ig domain protein [anaerobic digester metagenome]